MSPLLKLIPPALGAEVSALALLFHDTHSTAALLAFLGLHAIASALTALMLLPFVPAPYDRPRRWVLAFLFALNACMPLAGLIVLVFGVTLGLWLPRLARLRKYESVPVPVYVTFRGHEGTGYRGGQVRARLVNPSAPVGGRLQALIAVQHAPTRVTSTLLRDLLADPVDDMRLLAYGMIDSKEKAITQRIDEAREQLDSTDDREAQRVAHKQLAELHWELVYQRLVQGDMLQYTVEQAAHAARAALEVDDGDGGLWFLLARIEVTHDRLDDAEAALERALACGFPRERATPYFAELAFRRHRFAEVRRLMGELAETSIAPALAPARQYWRQAG